VTAPVLVLNGEQHEVSPVEMGRRAYPAANEPKRLKLFPHGNHVDLFDHGAWASPKIECYENDFTFEKELRE
jgi:fermentation-respiration switch protein FrsA (DUF1100 family)